MKQCGHDSFEENKGGFNTRMQNSSCSLLWANIFNDLGVNIPLYNVTIGEDVDV